MTGREVPQPRQTVVGGFDAFGAVSFAARDVEPFVGDLAERG
ncbi:hypothetical protein [Nonomuraea composti]|nr:hypothetical protein [Nonomuraea sp. FMUSA5-5]